MGSFLLACVMMLAVQPVSVPVSSPKPPLHITAFGVKRIEDCARQIHALTAELETLHFPHGWTIAIACTPVAWTTSMRKAENPPTSTAFTSLSARITVLNGAMFNKLRSEYRRSIAHELGHIACNCANEVQADAMALRLEREGTEISAVADIPATQK